jgi:hypothetical protein
MSKYAVRIYIDKKPYLLGSNATCMDLYAVSNLPWGFQIYMGSAADGEDEPLRCMPTPIHLNEGAHFHTGRRCHD